MLCVLYYIDVTYPPQAKYTQNKQACEPGFFF